MIVKMKRRARQTRGKIQQPMNGVCAFSLILKERYRLEIKPSNLYEWLCLFLISKGSIVTLQRKTRQTRGQKQTCEW